MREKLNELNEMLMGKMNGKRTSKDCIFDMCNQHSGLMSIQLMRI